MTKDESYRFAELIKDHLDGRCVAEYRMRATHINFAWEIVPADHNWDSVEYEYRRRPTKQFVPHTQETARPFLGLSVIRNDDLANMLVISVSPKVVVIGNTGYTYEQALCKFSFNSNPFGVITDAT